MIKKVLIIFLGLILLVACSNETNQRQETQENNANVENETEKESKAEKPIEYDELQQLYLDTDENTTYDDMIEMLEKSDFHYNDKLYTGGSRGIKVAFEEGVARFKRPDPGDYVEVSFENDKSMNKIEYINHDISIKLFHYIQGIYWELDQPEEHAGYYIQLYGGKAGDFTFKNRRGEEVETDYLKVDSKEEQFKYMYEHAGKNK